MSAMPSWTLVSVHIPKTAGTSLGAMLHANFGDMLKADYDDRPLSRPRWTRRIQALRHALAHAGERSQAACIHGHFLPLKYASMRGMRYSTWLRDPVQRVLSRYHHYQRHASDEPQHARWGLVPGLSLADFVRLPQYRDTCAEYLWAFPLRRFEFVGIVEDHASELSRFARQFELTVANGLARHNRNPEKAGTRYAVEPAMDRLIRRLNARDVALYEAALARR